MEQYVEDYIELNGKKMDDNSLDDVTINAVNKELARKGMTFTCEYMESTESHAYYKIQIEYSLRSAIFSFGKTHIFNGIARVDI